MKILIAGDYVPRERIAAMMLNDDFTYFDEISPIVKSADLSILNLEAPIVESDQTPIIKCGPNLRTSAKVIDSLKYAGFNMVTLANNHIMDFGPGGLQDTIAYLESADIKYVGIGSNLCKSQTIKYISIHEKRLAIINCCEHEFSIATENSAGANPLNPINQFYTIKEAHKNADYVIVIVHGGHEHWQLPSPRMVETYRFFIDAGADAVINHHQHCFSGFEDYKGKPIIYGLGNLCFEYQNHKDDLWNYGYMITLFLEDDISFEIHPYRQCSHSPKIELLDKKAFDHELKRLNDTLSDHNKLIEATTKYYESCSTQIKNIFEPYTSRIAKRLFRLGFLPSVLKGTKLQLIRNFIICESHRDKVNQIFKQL